MFLEALLFASILAKCSCDSSDQAVSSQRFHRHDVPLSYEFHSVHTYTTHKPHNEHNQRPVNQQSLQYASMDIKLEDTNPYNKQVTELTKSNDFEESTSKPSHLEPRVPNEDAYNLKHQRINSYVPGHNIVMQRFVPKHKYAGNENTKSRIHTKVNHVQPHIFYEDPQQFQINSSPNDDFKQTTVNPAFNPVYTLVAKHYYKRPLSDNALSVMEKPEHQTPAYIKTPALHLNVAQSHNFAHAPIQAPQILKQSYQKATPHSLTLLLSAISQAKKTYMNPMNH